VIFHAKKILCRTFIISKLQFFDIGGKKNITFEINWVISRYKATRKMQKTRFNIMAIGPNGIGKTTFLKALLQGYASKVNIDGEQNIHLRKQVGEKETLKIVQTGSAELNSENISTIKIYESLGYGDFINNENAIETISSYLVNAHANWRDLDAQVSK
jgi:septin family protein